MFMTDNRANLFMRQRLWLLFGRCSVRISVGTPSILTQILYDFHQSLHANVWILTLSNSLFTYYYCYYYYFFFGTKTPIWALVYLHETPFHFGFLDLRQSVGLLGRVISSSQGLYLYTNRKTHTHTHTHTKTLNIHALSGIRTHNFGYRDRNYYYYYDYTALCWALDPFSVSWSYTQPVGLLGWGISSSQGLYLHTEQPKYRINSHNTDIHALSGIRSHVRASEDS
jgi:hypothetical protein